MDELEIRRAVRDHYGLRAAGCCGDAASPCGGPSLIPLDVEGLKLGLGDPVGIAAPQEGETVLDLGSGPGLDVLKAAALVGPRGRAIGVDATPEMISTAREAARRRDVANAEFRLGEIEHLPVDTASVDVVVSDCVINLSPEKAQVFREAFRVLRPGGRLIVSDVIAEKELPAAVRADAAAWAACVAGAITEEEYVGFIRAAGFEDIRVLERRPWQPRLSSTLLHARKPGSP